MEPTYTDQLLIHLQKFLKPETYKTVSKHIEDFKEKKSEEYKAERERIKAKKNICYFGKYKGKTYDLIAQFDIKYLEWASRQSWIDEETKNRILKITKDNSN